MFIISGPHLTLIQKIIKLNFTSNLDTKYISQLVPGLKRIQECVEVPKEVCGTSRVNPRIVKKPSLMNWCFTPDCQTDQDCPQGFLCQDGKCLQEKDKCREDTECPDTDICEDGQCVPGNTVFLSFLCVFYKL